MDRSEKPRQPYSGSPQDRREARSRQGQAAGGDSLDPGGAGSEQQAFQRGSQSCPALSVSVHQNWG